MDSAGFIELRVNEGDIRFSFGPKQLDSERLLGQGRVREKVYFCLFVSVMVGGVSLFFSMVI